MRRDGLALAGVLVIAALVAGIGLTGHHFWDDEANTALFARNLRATGHLSAWDGTNVIGFRQGAELSPELRNIYMPPLQYGLCALGQALFGDTTFGGRFPFYLCGLLAVSVLFFLVRSHLAGMLPPFLPALLVALSPAFALYIRQCRYYSLAVLLSLGILLAFTVVARTSRRRLVALVSAGVCTGLLMFTNYLNAAALLASMPIFLLLRRYRTRDHLRFLGVAYGVALITGVIVLVTANPFSSVVAPKDGVTGLSRFTTLLWWHLSGLGSFEFFPLGVAILLLVLLVVLDRKRIQPLVSEGSLIVLFLFVYSAVTVICSPQPVGITVVADMRYVVPLIPLGAIASACLIVQIWRWRKLMRPVAIIVALLLCLTNVLHLGFLGKQSISLTLIRYLDENLHPYPSGTSELVTYAKTLPAGSTVQIFPDFMTYPAMYYAPKLHYIDQLAANRQLDPQLAASLPDYVFVGRVAPDYLIVGGVSAQAVLKSVEKQLGPGTYRYLTTLPGDYNDMTRPEIPWHRFGPPSPTESHPFVVIKKVAEKGIGKSAAM